MQWHLAHPQCCSTPQASVSKKFLSSPRKCLPMEQALSVLPVPMLQQLPVCFLSVCWPPFCFYGNHLRSSAYKEGWFILAHSLGGSSLWWIVPVDFRILVAYHGRKTTPLTARMQKREGEGAGVPSSLLRAYPQWPKMVQEALFLKESTTFS